MDCSHHDDGLPQDASGQIIDTNSAVAAMEYVAATWSVTWEMITANEAHYTGKLKQHGIPFSMVDWLRSWPSPTYYDDDDDDDDTGIFNLHPNTDNKLLYDTMLKRVVHQMLHSTDLPTQIACASVCSTAALHSDEVG